METKKVRIYLIACRQLGETLDRTMTNMPNIEHFYYDYTKERYDFSKQSADYDMILVLKGIKGVNVNHLKSCTQPMKVLWFNDNIDKYPKEFNEFKHYFDKVFTINKESMRYYGFVGCGVDVTQFKDLGIERDINVSFVGNLNPPEREQVINRLRKDIGLRHFIGIKYPEYINVLNRSKITVNMHWNRFGANMRFYEALGTKSLMITDQVEGIPHRLEEGKHYITYETIPELINQVNYYLNNEDKRKEITENAYEIVRKYYKYEDRINELVKKCRLEYKTYPLK